MMNPGHVEYFRAVTTRLSFRSSGKGKSSGPIDRALYADFTTALVAALGLKRVVFVSPSSSGRYSLIDGWIDR